jgi:hypothetical protein
MDPTAKSVENKDSFDPVELTTNRLPSITIEDRTKLFNILCDIYDKRFRPPGYNDNMDWARLAYTEQHSFNKYAPAARIYTTSNKPDQIIQRLVTEREPVNIDMRHLFNRQSIQEHFGYNTSYYQRYWNKTKTICSNIGVYTLVPILHKEKQSDIHLYHAIGYAFDNIDQPDYNAILGDDTVSLSVKTKILIQLYKNVFKCIFRCAVDQKLKHIVMSIIGGGAFSLRYPGGRDSFQKNIWIPAFESIIGMYPEIVIECMGVEPGMPVTEFFESKGYANLGRFPDLLSNQSFDNDQTLIVNAWDCHSFPGNGNKGDNSLDGWIGRFTPIQFFGCGLTNPYLLKNIFRVS